MKLFAELVATILMLALWTAVILNLPGSQSCTSEPALPMRAGSGVQSDRGRAPDCPPALREQRSQSARPEPA